MKDRKFHEQRILCSMKQFFKNEGKCQDRLQIKKMNKMLY